MRIVETKLAEHLQLTSGERLWVLQADECEGVTLILGKDKEEAEANALKHLELSFGDTDENKKAFAEWLQRCDDDRSWWMVIPVFGRGAVGPSPDAEGPQN